MATALSFIGIISLLAGEIVEGALRYANVIKYRYLVSLFVVPGLYSVSIRLLKRCDNRLAFILSPGSRESKQKVLGLESSGTYKYVGMHSGTKASVKNVLLESWINIKNREYEKKESTTKAPYKLQKDIEEDKHRVDKKDSVMMRKTDNIGSKSTLGQAKCKLNKEQTSISVCEPMYLAVAIVLQAGAIAIFVLMVIERNIEGITINILNMAAYFLISIFICKDQYKIPEPKTTENVPPGDILITNKSNNNMWIVEGNERDIQSAAQKEIQIDGDAYNFAETVVYTAGSLVAITTILLVPIMSTKAQTYITIQFSIGLLVSIVFSSRDGEKMLKDLYDKHYSMEPVKITKFTNRATAVAAAVFRTNANVQYIYKNIIPETHDYDTYRKVLKEITHCMKIYKESTLHEKEKTNEEIQMYVLVHKLEECKDQITSAKKSVENIIIFAPDETKSLVDQFQEAFPCAKEILLLSDATHSIGNKLRTWPGRLLMDIIEAFAEVYIYDK